MPQKRILVVDDDHTILDMLGLALARADFDVLRAPGGDVGLRRFKDDAPDLAIVDIAMPGIDGYELIERIRKVETERGVEPPNRLPIVILSAHEQSVMREYADEIGVELYLIKPIKPVDLVKHINNLLA